MNWSSKALTAPVLVGFAIVVAEVLLTQIDGILGAGLYGLILVGLLLLSSTLEDDDPVAASLYVLSIIPMLRILSVGVSLFLFPPLFQFVILGIPLYVTLLGVVWAIRFPWRTVALQPKGLLLNLALILVAPVLGGITIVTLRLPELAEGADILLFVVVVSFFLRVAWKNCSSEAFFSKPSPNIWAWAQS